MRTIVTAYSFSAATRQITFTGLSSVSLGSLFLIVDATTNTTIYQANTSSLGGTVVGNVLTLTYDTSVGGFANGDSLQIFYEGVSQVADQDGATLQTATVSSAGVGASINTSGYNSITIQASGNGAGNVYIQGSNDNANWQPLLLTALDSYDATDAIRLSGNYGLKVSTLYIQYSATLIAGSMTLIFVGRSAPGASSADKLAMAMNPETQYPLNVNIQSGLKTDAQGAPLQSDAPMPIWIRDLAVGSFVIIDTTGYQSLGITTQALAGTVTASNDGITFAALTGSPIALSVAVTAVVANTNYIFPCLARYIKITATTAGTAAAYLRSAPYNPFYTTSNNVTQLIGNVAIVNGGVNGVPSVGGNVAAGAVPTAFPVPVGGIDTLGKTQRLLTDTSGRVQIANSSAPQGPYNNPSLFVQDTSMDNGNLIINLLSSILLELQIANQQRYEYNFGVATENDEPSGYRNDPSMFTT